MLYYSKQKAMLQIELRDGLYHRQKKQVNVYG